MAKVNYGTPSGNAGLSNAEIARLLYQQQQLSGPNQGGSYDPLADALAPHPVHSIGQGLADVGGQLGKAYFDKQRYQALMGLNNTNAEAYKKAALIAGDSSLAQTPNGQLANLAGGMVTPQGQNAGQIVPNQGDNSQLAESMGQPNTPYRYGQLSLPNDSTGNYAGVGARPLSANERFAQSVQGLNGQQMQAYEDKLRQTAMAAQPPPPIATDVKAGSKVYLRDATTGQPTGQVLDGGVEPTPLMKTLQARGVDMNSPEAKKALADEQAILLHTDPASLQNASNARTTGALEAERLKQLQSGALDDDTIMRIATQVGKYGDTQALQNMGRGTQGAANLAKVNNAITQLGLTPGELAAAKVKMKVATVSAEQQGKRGAGIDTAASELETFGDQALEASKLVPREKFMPWNKLENYVRTNVNDANMATLFTAIQGVRNGYAGMMSRNGNPTVNYMQHADDLLNGAQDSATLAAVIGQMKKEAVGAKSATSSTQDKILTGQFGPQGGVPAPIAAPAGDIPPGVDPALWSHLTPQEKALWQKK